MSATRASRCTFAAAPRRSRAPDFGVEESALRLRDPDAQRPRQGHRRRDGGPAKGRDGQGIVQRRPRRRRARRPVDDGDDCRAATEGYLRRVQRGEDRRIASIACGRISARRRSCGWRRARSAWPKSGPARGKKATARRFGNALVAQDPTVLSNMYQPATFFPSMSLELMVPVFTGPSAKDLDPDFTNLTNSTQCFVASSHASEPVLRQNAAVGPRRSGRLGDEIVIMKYGRLRARLVALTKIVHRRPGARRAKSDAAISTRPCQNACVTRSPGRLSEASPRHARRPVVAARRPTAEQGRTGGDRHRGRRVGERGVGLGSGDQAGARADSRD